MKRWIQAAAAAVTLAAGVSLFAPIASAHHATFTVMTECRDDGSWVASWRIQNSESGKVMDITSEDVTDLSPNPTPKSGASTDQTSHSNGTTSVTAHVTVDWVYHEPANVSVTAHRPEGCVPPTTTTTVPPTTTTTAPDTTTTVPPPTTIPPVTVTHGPTPVVITPEFTG